MFIPGSTPTNTNSSMTMNNNLHQQQFLFDTLKDHRSNKLSSPMSRKTSATPNFSLDPDILRELNARYLHDINSTRPPPPTGTNSNLDGNGLPAFLLPSPFLRAEHYHQHTHTHEHNLNILTPSTNSLLNGNALLDKLSKSDNSLSPFLRTTAVNNFSLPPPPPMFPPFGLINNPTANTNSSPINPTNTNNTNTSNHNNNNNNTRTKESSSPPAKKSSKWCAAHVRISWMIYHQQQRLKEKLSSSDNKKTDDEQQQSSANNKLSDFISNTKPLLPPSIPTNNDLSLPLSSTFQTPLLPLPPAFNFRSPFDFANVNNGSFGRVAPSSNTAFGGLGSIFPSLPPPLPPLPSPSSSSSSSMDRKSDLNGSVVAAAALGLDWSRFHRGIGPSQLIPPLPSHPSTNDSLSSKKLDEINNNNSNSNNDKKRSSSVLNNNDDDRRNSHHHLMHPPSHLTNNNYSSSSNRSRSRSPHPSLHQHPHHSSSSLLNKTSSSPPPSLHSSSSRKRSPPHIKSDGCSKSSSHPPSPLIPLPPTFGAFDPLTLSIIERQRLSNAYASLVANASQANNFFPGNLDPTMFRSNGSSSLFSNVDSSAMTIALMQREHFLNSVRQQQELIERERAAVASINKTSKLTTTTNPHKIEQTSPKYSIEEPTIRKSPKVATSPSSHSSTSTSSSSSKKVKHIKCEQKSLSPSATIPLTKENIEIIPKEETNIESTVS